MSGPDIWGPHGWKFIHYITLGYPANPTNETKKQYSNFFTLLKDVIPCSICGNNYSQHIKQYPLTDEILNDKREFINWGITMHNLVNILNKKPIYNKNLEDLTAENTGDCPGYTNTSLNKSTSINKYKLYNTILVVIIILLLLYYYIKHINK